MIRYKLPSRMFLTRFVSHYSWLLRQVFQAAPVPELRGTAPRKIRGIVFTQAELRACITRNAIFSKKTTVDIKQCTQIRIQTKFTKCKISSFYKTNTVRYETEQRLCWDFSLKIKLQ